MCYEIIKSMRLTEQNDKLKFNALIASNNIFPLRFERWVEEITWEELFYQLIDRMWKPYYSANDGFWTALTVLTNAINKKNGYNPNKVCKMYVDILNGVADDKTKEEFNQCLETFKQNYKLLQSFNKCKSKCYLLFFNNLYVTKITKNTIAIGDEKVHPLNLYKAIINYFRIKKYCDYDLKIVTDDYFNLELIKIIDSINTL